MIFQILLIINIIYQTFDVKVGLNIMSTKIFNFKPFVTSFYYDNFFQILYSIYLKLNQGLNYFIFILSKVFNFPLYSYVKTILIFRQATLLINSPHKRRTQSQIEPACFCKSKYKNHVEQSCIQRCIY